MEAAAVQRCENEPERAAIGMTGNEQLMCARCLAAEYAYARSHVPEAITGLSEAGYVAECMARMAEARP